MIDIPEEIKNKLVISITISFVSEDSLKDATEFCGSFNKTMHSNINCEITPSGKEHLLTIDFNTPVYESILREVVKDFMVKINIQSSEIKVTGWMTA